MFDIVSYHITSDVYLIASMQNNGLYDTMLENSQLRFNKYPQVKVIYLMGSKFYSLYFFYFLPDKRHLALAPNEQHFDKGGRWLPNGM